MAREKCETNLSRLSSVILEPGDSILCIQPRGIRRAMASSPNTCRSGFQLPGPGDPSCVAVMLAFQLFWWSLVSLSLIFDSHSTYHRNINMMMMLIQ